MPLESVCHGLARSSDRLTTPCYLGIGERITATPITVPFAVIPQCQDGSALLCGIIIACSLAQYS